MYFVFVLSLLCTTHICTPIISSFLCFTQWRIITLSTLMRLMMLPKRFMPYNLTVLTIHTIDSELTHNSTQCIYTSSLLLSSHTHPMESASVTNSPLAPIARVRVFIHFEPTILAIYRRAIIPLFHPAVEALMIDSEILHKHT